MNRHITLAVMGLLLLTSRIASAQSWDYSGGDWPTVALQQPSPTEPAPSTSAAESAIEPLAQQTEQLARQVEEIGKHLTVTTASEDVKLVLGGAITADFFFHEARPVSAGIPFFLTPASPLGFGQETFDATARQTTFFAMISLPEVCDFEAGGFVLVSLFNDALIVDRYGLLPIQAYGQLKNDCWRFAAGLQNDIFNPLNPTVLPFSFLGASGNVGAFRGQARAERYFYPSHTSQWTLIAGISEPLPTTVREDFDFSEDNGWPNVEGRIALGLGRLEGQGPEARRPLEFGASGVLGQIRTIALPDRVVADIWGLGTDARWAITPRCGVQGEVFVGETLGTYMGGILQNVNTDTFTGVESVGGWGEMYYYLCPNELHTHIGYGIDDPLDSDLAAIQPLRNETFFANLIWDVTKHFRLAGELNYRKTAYAALLDNEGLSFQTQAQWRF
jgi:hypothetical protein